MANKFLIVCGGSGVGLLGQRALLGLKGELQIDVSNEIKQSIRDKRDYPNSLYVALDEAVGTTRLLLQSLEDNIDPTAQVRQSIYLHTKVSKAADINHAQFLLDHWRIGQDLAAGLAQSPAIGGRAIRQSGNVSELKSVLETMVTTLATNAGQANPLDFWIISSTAGGTGEGIHRFVGAQIAEACRLFGPIVRINFIRVGPLTYKSISPKGARRNSFFGVAADAAYALKMQQDFPYVTTHWFYVDVHDVGNDKAKRAELIDMAAKAIMLDDLQSDLKALLVNKTGVPMVPVRTGFWGRDFGQQRLFYEVLLQLIGKLQHLIDPEDLTAKYITGKPALKVIYSELLEEVIKNLGHATAAAAKHGWRFPKTAQRDSINDQFGIRLTNEKISGLIQDLNKLAAPRRLEQLPIRYDITEMRQHDDQTINVEVPLAVPAPDQKVDMFEAIESAQRVLAWCKQELRESADGQPGEGLEAKLVRLVRTCASIQHDPRMRNGGSEQRASELVQKLPELLRILLRVQHLRALESSAQGRLDRELTVPNQVLARVLQAKEEISAETTDGTPCPVIAAELWTRLDHLNQRSWLALLIEAAQRANNDFKKEVLKGGIGLTEDGLSALLGARRNATADEIREILRAHMGQMHSTNLDSKEASEDFEAAWWQAHNPIDPSPTMRKPYRIFPALAPSLLTKLNFVAQTTGPNPVMIAQDGSTRYVASASGLIGLYVLAFEAVSLSQVDLDKITAPKYLLKPLVGLIREYLNDWPTTPTSNNLGGHVDIAVGGVIGEPLYGNALREAGLTDQEIQKIKQYYEIFET